VSKPSGQRLAFQAKAAAVQQEASRLILVTTALFGRLFATAAWSEEDVATSASIAKRGAAMAEAWRGLEPTSSLEPIWKDLSTQFDALAGLFAEVGALRDVPTSALLVRIRVLQASFTDRLERMNRLETRLVESEEILRLRAAMGLQDE
jgi:hypothetical protein